MDKLLLKDDGQGISRKSYDDQDGCKWIETDTSGYLDENVCDKCNHDVSQTITCLDGGETYCGDCLHKFFNVTFS